MKKLLALLVVAGVMVAGCASEKDVKPFNDEDALVVVKHKVDSSNIGDNTAATTIIKNKQKHHKKTKHHSIPAAKFGS